MSTASTVLWGHIAATSDAQILGKLLLAHLMAQGDCVPSPRSKIHEMEILGVDRDAWVQKISRQTLHPEVVEVKANTQ
jgi:hypothetical protein